MKWNLILILSFFVGLKILETVEVKSFETTSSEINNQTNWLLDLYKKSKSKVKNFFRNKQDFYFFLKIYSYQQKKLKC